MARQIGNVELHDDIITCRIHFVMEDVDGGGVVMGGVIHRLPINSHNKWPVMQSFQVIFSFFVVRMNILLTKRVARDLKRHNANVTSL